MKNLLIQLNEDYRSFKNGFNISLDGDLILLSGINGSGKSQLMDIISQRENYRGRKAISATINLSGANITRNDILKRSFKENIKIPDLTHAGMETVVSHKENTWNAYNNYLLDYNNENLWDYKESCESAKVILKEKFGEQKFINKEITRAELKDALPQDFVWRSDDIFTNFIGELFFNYASDVYEAKAKCGENGIKFNSSGFSLSPWKQLNNLFSELGFEYRFKDNYYIKNFQINEQPCLYQIKNDSIDKNESRKLSDLSDGEKAIVSLSFASLSDAENEHKKILLLDEFDATFNPSLTKVFYNILDKYFVSKGIMVVIATHSPTTISLAPDNAVFYELFKQNSGSSRILPVQKKDYTELKKVNEIFFDKISNQNDRIKQLKSEVDKLQEIKDGLTEKIKSTIITEGKTDVQHIEKAQKKLNINDCDIDFFEIKGDWGDSKLKLLLEQVSKVEQTKKIIGIFDRDNKDIISDIEKNGQAFKDYGNNVYAFCIPRPEDREEYVNISIEFYYNDKNLKKEKEGKCLCFDNEVEQLYNKRTKKNEIRKLDHRDTSTENEKKIFCEDIGNENWIHSKSKFADLVSTDDDFIRDFDFSNFELIFNVIKKILKS